MTDFARIVAGFMAGAGAIALIMAGDTTEGALILTSLIAFYAGEKNGTRKGSTDKG